MADLDSRLTSVAQDKVKVNEKLAVLQANADKLNPNKNVTSSETVRCVGIHRALKNASIDTNQSFIQLQLLLSP